MNNILNNIKGQIFGIKENEQFTIYHTGNITEEEELQLNIVGIVVEKVDSDEFLKMITGISEEE